jgi:hypothetical protein
MQAMIGQSPQASMVMASMQAHIAEHLAFKYRADIEKALGVPLPPLGEPLPPDIETSLSSMVAAASREAIDALMLAQSSTTAPF